MDRARAEESIAVRFTRVMNATPSPYGVLSDVVVATVVAALIVFAGFFVIEHLSRPAAHVWTVFGIAAIPIVASLGVSLSLRARSRRRVVAWLESLPFEVVNLNAVLAGVGDTVEVTFIAPATLPTRAELSPTLDAVHPDLLLTDERPEERTIAIRLGVIDSKRNPMGTNHVRWLRLCETVEKILIPMHRERPIERLRIV